MDRVAVALGSNLGDRAAHLNHAVARLSEFLADLRVSRFYTTVPVGAPGPQLLFLNAAAVGEASLAPREILERLLAIEQERHRARPYPNAARTLDLDLILYGQTSIDEPGLTVPHPRFRDRRFVLEPLAEIAPEMIDPSTRLSIAELFERCQESSGRPAPGRG
jgi:2-amino-4-hydroxy-6-hydroxymethyldihydropteridine diphosphokinase